MGKVWSIMNIIISTPLIFPIFLIFQTNTGISRISRISKNKKISRISRIEPATELRSRPPKFSWVWCGGSPPSLIGRYRLGAPFLAPFGSNRHRQMPVWAKGTPKMVPKWCPNGAKWCPMVQLLGLLGLVFRCSLLVEKGLVLTYQGTSLKTPFWSQMPP